MTYGIKYTVLIVKNGFLHLKIATITRVRTTELLYFYSDRFDFKQHLFLYNIYNYTSLNLHINHFFDKSNKYLAL